MMRRWRESIERVRCYSASRRIRRELRHARTPFEWLRVARRRGGPQLVVNARVAVAVGVHVHAALGMQRALTQSPQRPSHPRRTINRGVTQLPILRRPTPVFVHVAQGATLRERKGVSRERITTQLSRQYWTERRTTSRLGVTFVAAERLRDTLVSGALPLSLTNGHWRNDRTHSVRVERTNQLRHSQVRGSRVMMQTTRVVRVAAARVRREAGAATSTSATRPLSLENVERVTVASPMTTRAFAAQSQPFAVPASRPVQAEPVSVERIEKTLRESLSVVAERMVQRELQRTLAPGSLASRRLRESIQSEMYDDLVLERERRGGR